MKLIISLLVNIVFIAEVLQAVSGSVCQSTSYKTTYGSERVPVSCGFWNWNTCWKYQQTTSLTPTTEKTCCSGTYGEVQYGCPGDCPLSSVGPSSECGGAMCRDYKCDQSGMTSTYPTFKVHENDNQAKYLMSVISTCFAEYTCPDCSCNCTREKSSLSEHERNDENTCLCSANVPCTQCQVSNTQHFKIKNGVELWRRACNSNCADCTTEVGCFNAATAYDQVVVTCSATDDLANDKETLSFSVEVEAADEPHIYLQSVMQVINANIGIGEKVAGVTLTLGQTPGTTSFVLTGAKSPVSGINLFAYDEASGEVVVAADLTKEPTHSHNLTLCVNTRRSVACDSIVVMIVSITTSTTTSTTSTTSTTLTTTTTPTTTKAPTTSTTSTTSTTPTTSTSTSTVSSLTTSALPLGKACVAVGSWANVEGMNEWCQSSCNNAQPNCPEDMCTCDLIQALAKVRSQCTPVDLNAAGMDDWCDLNCNTEYPTECKPDVCTCVPPVDYTVIPPSNK